MTSVLVSQLGARRHYAVPMAFDAHGLLGKLCTDLMVDAGWQSRLVRTAGTFTGLNGLRRLADRQANLVLSTARIRTFPWFGLAYKWRGLRAKSAEARTANWLWGGERFASLCAAEMDSKTTAVYAFTSAARELFSAAADRGAQCWLDYATAPRSFEVGLIQEEADRFPGWAQRPIVDGLTETYLQRQEEEVKLANRIICGSSFAMRAVEAQGTAAGKVVVVPLGVADHLFSGQALVRPARPGLRVLYVGADGLRKGIGYLERALELLDRTDICARAAGDLELSEVALRRLRKRIEVLGTVARSDLPVLFDWADVLVLPSISDTFGMVILEAMAAGLPVIATENTCAPDILRPGKDGYLVPIRDATAIASALSELADDPGRRVEMGASARRRAEEFTVSKYGARLVSALLEGQRQVSESIE